MTRAVTAAVFTPQSGDECELQTLYLDDPAPDEIVMQVKACGICHTDIAAASYNERPCVLGHEAAGIIVEVGSDIRGFGIGERVVATFSSCQSCGNCQDNAPAYCHDFMTRNFGGRRPNGRASFTRHSGEAVSSAFFQQSGFADHILVRADNIVKIPDDVDFAQAAPVGCAIQTGAGTILNSFDAQSGQSIVVFGAGAVGLAAIMAARHRGCSPIIAVDINEGRLKLAAQYGANHALNGNQDDLAEQIKALTQGGAHFTLEGVGMQSVFHHAINSLRPKGVCGTLGYPGIFGEGIVYPANGAFMTTRHMGIVEGDSVPEQFIPQIFDMLKNGELPFDGLTTKFAFKDINEAIKACKEKRVVKAVLIFD